MEAYQGVPLSIEINASKTIVSKIDTSNTIASLEMLHTIDVPMFGNTHTSAGRSPAVD